MNQKASVSKELNAKHRKILEGLLKLPQNRECADCKTRAPRWASVNLGIFICMQCSGIHRSLGVHISKVRSATLDTWLPEQIACIQSMGNDKSNSYWEAELPPNDDRVGIENFIRAKYEHKRWVPRDGKLKSPPRVSEEKILVHRALPETTSTQRGPVKETEKIPVHRVVAETSTQHVHVKETERLCEEKNRAHPPSANNKAPQQVSNDPKPCKVEQNSKPEALKAEPARQEATSTPVSQPVKLDYATELFNLLCMDESRGNDFVTSADKNTVAGAHDAPHVTQPLSLKPQNDVNGVMSLFEKSSMVSPFSMHQQQLATISQHQSLLPAASAKSSGARSFPANAQPGSHAVHAPVGNLVPTRPQPYTQIGNGYHKRPVGNAVPFPTSSMYAMRPVTPVNGVTNIRANGFSSASPMYSRAMPPTKSGRDFDFSSLTEGLFTKR